MNLSVFFSVEIYFVTLAIVTTVLASKTINAKPMTYLHWRKLGQKSGGARPSSVIEKYAYTVEK